LNVGFTEMLKGWSPILHPRVNESYRMAPTTRSLPSYILSPLACF
jgi:hypothetical protein